MISDHAVEHLVSSAKDKHADVVISKFVCKKDTLDVRNGLSVCIETDLLKKVLLNFRQYIGNIPEGYTFPNEWALAYSWGRLYHISLLNKGIRFNENLILGEDVLFNYDIFNASKNVCFLNQNLYFYRQHEESVTAKFQKRRLSNTIILSHEIEKRTEAEEKEIKKAGYQFILGRVVHCYTAYFPYIDQEKRTREEKKLISISYINRAVLKGKLRYCSFDKRVLCKSIGIKFLAFKMYIKRIVNKV